MYKLLLLGIILVFAIQTGYSQQKAPASQNANPGRKSDTSRIIIQNILPAEREIKIDTALHKLIVDKLSGKQDHNFWEKNFPIAISTLFSLLAFTISFSNFRRDKKYKDLSFIAEIDKLLLQNPELWAYEDSKKKNYLSTITISKPVDLAVEGSEKLEITGPYTFNVKANSGDVSVKIGSAITSLAKDETRQFTGSDSPEMLIVGSAELNFTHHHGIVLQSIDDKLLDAKLDAFCYYKLNNFELALQGHSRSAKRAWKKYFHFIYNKSTRFREIIDVVKTTNVDIYNQRFIKKIDKLLRERGG